MIEGILLINLEPSYMGFFPKPGNALTCCTDTDSWCYCTQDQIKALLLDLEILLPHQNWPPREYILRLPVTLPRTKLAKHGLAKPHIHDPLKLPQPALMRRIS